MKNNKLASSYIYIYSVALAIILCTSAAYAESIFDQPNFTVNAGSGWSSSDQNKHASDINSAIGTSKKYTDDKLAGFESKVNSQLQNVGAGQVYTYVISCHSQGGSCDNGPIVETSSNSIVCPFGKKPNLHEIYKCKKPCTYSSYVKAYSLGNPPCK